MNVREEFLVLVHLLRAVISCYYCQNQCLKREDGLFLFLSIWKPHVYSIYCNRKEAKWSEWVANELVIYFSVYWCEMTSQSVCRPNNEVSRGQEVKGRWMRALTPADPAECAREGQKMKQPSLLAGSCSHSQFLSCRGFCFSSLGERESKSGRW